MNRLGWLVLFAGVVCGQGCGEVREPAMLDVVVDQEVPDDEMCGPDSPWYECQAVQQQVEAGSALGWRIPSKTRTIAEKQYVAYDAAPAWNNGANCAKGLTPGARELGDYLLEHFETYQIQGYNCRVVAGTNSMSVHGTGRAVDVMIRTANGRADNSKGDAIGNWLIEHAKEIGIQYVIWDRTQWKPYASGREDSYYSGVSPHYDHLHVELTKEAAARNTAWFKQRNFQDPPDGVALSANFEAAPLRNNPGRANLKLVNTSAEPFANVVMGYEVPDFFAVEGWATWRKGAGESSWTKIDSGARLANIGKVAMGRLGKGASKRLVLDLKPRGTRSSGVVKGWVRHIDALYKGANTFDAKPTLNAFEGPLRGKATVTVDP